MKVVRCFNCMKEIESYPCPNCGFDPTENPQPAEALLWNTILHGRYLVGKMMGQGGFGITYVGWDLTLETKVAIKEFFPNGYAMRGKTSPGIFWSNSTGLQNQLDTEMFLKEARKMAKIGSIPEIVRVLDTFNENNTAYIVMEFVEGMTIKDYIEQYGPMDFDTAVRLLSPMLEALDKVHEKGLIHRDISPDNIMLLNGGGIRLLDFGAAKDLSVQKVGGSSQLVVKHGFSPIEQYGSIGNIGPWTDVYAVCATIYYMITGKVLADAPSRMENDAIDFSGAIGKPLTQQQRETLTRGLAIKSEERIQTIRELLDRLKPAEPEPPAPVPVPDLKERLIMRVARICVAAVVIFVVGICAIAIMNSKSVETSTDPVEESTVTEETATETESETQAASDTDVDETDAADDETQEALGEGVQYRLDGTELYLTGYTGSEDYIIVPWTVGDIEVTGIHADDSFPEDVKIYEYVQLSELNYSTYDSYALVYHYTGQKTDGYPYLVFPGEVDGLPVYLGSNLFNDNEEIEGVILEEGITKICDRVFYGCENLKFLKLPQTLRVIGTLAFGYIDNLTEVNLPEGVEEVGSSAFAYGGLEVINLPSTLTTIGDDNPFASTSLKEITVAEGNQTFYLNNRILLQDSKIIAVPAVEHTGTCFEIPDGFEIGNAAFYGSRYTALLIRGGVETIPAYAFAYSHFQSVVLEDGVTTIEGSAFANCEEMCEITIPESVETIESGAFIGCSNLTSVTISEDCNVGDWGLERVFEGTVQINYY